mgnify:CR=1 FL=1
MTVSNTPRRAGPYRGDGTSVAYPFFATNDLRVYTADTDGNERELARSEYTVNADIAAQPRHPGGSIRLHIPLPDGHLLTIISKMDYVQPAEFTNSGGFYPAVLNDSLDRQTIYVQQLEEIQSRSIVGAVNGGGGTLSLPAGAPGRVLKWDGTGKRLTNGEADLDAQGKQILHELGGIRDAMKALKGGAEALEISKKVDKIAKGVDDALATVHDTLTAINKTQQDQNAALRKIRILALAGL